MMRHFVQHAQQHQQAMQALQGQHKQRCFCQHILYKHNAQTGSTVVHNYAHEAGKAGDTPVPDTTALLHVNPAPDIDTDDKDTCSCADAAPVKFPAANVAPVPSTLVNETPVIGTAVSGAPRRVDLVATSM